jgi:hypothetical protein
VFENPGNTTCGGVTVSQRRLFQRQLLTGLRSREPGVERNVAIGLAMTLVLLLRLCRSCLNRQKPEVALD